MAKHELIQINDWYCKRCGTHWIGGSKPELRDNDDCDDGVATQQTHKWKCKWGRRLGMTEWGGSVYMVKWWCERCGLEEERPEGVYPGSGVKCAEIAMERVLG